MTHDDHNKAWHVVHSAGVSNSANLFDSIVRAVEVALARERREAAERCAGIAADDARCSSEGIDGERVVWLGEEIAARIRAEFGLEGK